MAEGGRTETSATAGFSAKRALVTTSSPLESQVARLPTVIQVVALVWARLRASGPVRERHLF